MLFERGGFRCCVNAKVYPTDQDENPNLAVSLARRPEAGINNLASIVEVRVESHRDGYVRIIVVIIWKVLVSYHAFGLRFYLSSN